MFTIVITSITSITSITTAVFLPAGGGEGPPRGEGGPS